MADAQILSASSLNTFLRCAKQWEYAYVYEYKRPPSIRQVIGLAAHSAVELNYAQKVQTGTDLPVDDVTDAFSDAFDSLALEMVPDPEDEGERPAAGKDSGIKTVGVYQRTVAPTVQPAWVEREVQFAVDGVPYAGTIDLVDTKGRIRDLKNVRKRPSNDRSDYLIAMTGYAIGYRQETSQIETEVVLDYMVRTKTPYYWPVTSTGPVTDNAISQFARLVEQVSATIKTGIFLPTGLGSFACGWCGYRDICDAVRR